MKKYGLIGKVLGHSFSSRYFNTMFAEEGIDAVYDNYEIPAAEDFMKVVEDPEIIGLNVTIPYKQDVVPMMDSLSEEASAIGAVNVVKIIRNLSQSSQTKNPYDTSSTRNTMILKGYNTDVIGFRESIRPLLKPWHTHALVLGTGGASLAVKYGLHQLGVVPLSVSRTPQDTSIISYSDLTKEVMDTHLVVVNCTPLGTFPNTDGCADIPYHLLTSRHLLYDLVYNPELTRFLSRGKDKGALVKNGYEMLILQAKAAWKIWNNEAE